MNELESLLRRAVSDAQAGFLTEADVADLQRLDPERQLLVRCGQGRFITRAQTVPHFVGLVEASGLDYVRDVCLLGSDRVYTGDRLRFVPVTPPPRPTRQPLTVGNSFAFSPSDADPGL